MTTVKCSGEKNKHKQKTIQRSNR